MTELLSKTLAGIVTENHQSAAVLEKYHLDFCCKGKRTLKDACSEKKVNPAEVLLDLEKVMNTNTASDLDPQKMTLDELSAYITETHHSYVRNELPLIFGYLQKVTSKHGEQHPELFNVFELFGAIKEELELHMQKEEKILFPRIAETEMFATGNSPLPVNNTFIAAPVSVMEQEHEHAGSMIEEIRLLTNNYTPPGDACTTYRLAYAALQAFEQDLHRHVHLENNILFPRAMSLFSHTGDQSLN